MGKFYKSDGGSPRGTAVVFGTWRSKSLRHDFLDGVADSEHVLVERHSADLVLAFNQQKARLAGYAAYPPVELDIVGEILVAALSHLPPRLGGELHSSLGNHVVQVIREFTEPFSQTIRLQVLQVFGRFLGQTTEFLHQEILPSF